MEQLEIRTQTTQSAERLFEELYETAFPPVAKFVSKMNGSFDDAKDVFQDALVIYFEKMQRADFHITTSPEAYMLGIAKHLWTRKFNRDRKQVSLERVSSEIFSQEEAASINDQKLLQLIESTGKKCLDLLRAFYYEKLSLRNIAQHFQFSSERSATVQKFKCVEKMRDTLQTKSISHEDFLD